MQQIGAYYRLAKPGIVYGNSLALIIGYFFAVLETASFAIAPLLYALIGTGFVMASACVINNILDRDIDAYMKRTKSRAMVMRTIATPYAWLYAYVLFATGVILLAAVSMVLVILGVVGWVTYSFAYTHLKRLTYHATLFGTIPGAAPPLIGYVAGGGSSWVWASVLFLVMLGWQMAHFYAISIVRDDEYADAKVPVVTRVIGVAKTRDAIQWWVLMSAVALVLLGFINGVYAVCMLVLLGWWLRMTYDDQKKDAKLWAKGVFVASLKFLLGWLLMTIICALWLLV